jgi:hypothetical protein
VPWWGWLVAIVVVVVLLAVLFRRWLRYAIRVAKALATDERLPKPLRWALRIALAIKVVPVPDMGIDEVLLVVVGILLLTIYRPTLRAIMAESAVGLVDQG